MFCVCLAKCASTGLQAGVLSADAESSAVFACQSQPWLPHAHYRHELACVYVNCQ